jgi:hypothetical protein
VHQPDERRETAHRLARQAPDLTHLRSPHRASSRSLRTSYSRVRRQCNV